MRIGIVGSDNSHALAYAKIANVDKSFEPYRVTTICGDDPQKTKEVAAEGAIPTIVDSPQEMLGHIDAAIVVNRHGGLHAGNSIPLLESGIPVYVDKPFAVSLDDCTDMLAAAERGNTWVTSFSSLRYSLDTVSLEEEASSFGRIRAAQFAGPCDFESEYAGPFFYATHVADIMLRLMNGNIKSISAIRADQGVAVTVQFEDDALVVINYMNDAQYHFTATLFGETGYAHREILAGHGAYTTAFGVFVEALESNTPPIPHDQLDVPIRFVHAIDQSLNSGGKSVSLAEVSHSKDMSR